MAVVLLFLAVLVYPFNLALFAKEKDQSVAFTRQKETEDINKICSEYAKFYELGPDAQMADITQELLASPLVKEAQKEAIVAQDRKILVFVYPSDGLKIKGLLSYLPQAQNQPLVVFLRGGNRIFGITNPGSDLICLEQATVISTMYRGGVSEGNDEFGGDDVKNEQEWINYRDPLLAAEHIKQHLPILIIQGNDDNRVILEEGYNMLAALQAAGCDVTYWEIEGGKHCLSNDPERGKLIINWFLE